MRVGMNPARGKYSDYRPARVTVAILVHIPHHTGYFAGRMDVLRACLTSLIENTREPYDLLVFNNGSSPEVRAYLEDLQREGAIDYLLHSRINVGKIGAFQILFRAAPGEVVAYADDDIYFYPGWLGEHLKILDTFPSVGMVSGCAVRTLFNMERISANLEFAERNPEVVLHTGRFIEETWMRDWAVSYGRDPEEVRAQTEDVVERILEYRGLQAFAMANHNQFVSPKEVIVGCLPDTWSGRLMGLMDELDVAVNQAGYLRLTTRQRTTQHMGNTLGPEFATQLGMEIEASQPALALTSKRGRWARWRRKFLLSRPVRWFLLGVYSRLFKLLHPE